MGRPGAHPMDEETLLQIPAKMLEAQGRVSTKKSSLPVFGGTFSEGLQNKRSQRGRMCFRCL